MTVRLDRLVYCTVTVTHISVRVFLLMDGQKLGILEIAGVLLQRVPTYETKQYIYVHMIFCNELTFTTKFIKKINFLAFGIKLKLCNYRNKNFKTFLLKLTPPY